MISFPANFPNDSLLCYKIPESIVPQPLVQNLHLLLLIIVLLTYHVTSSSTQPSFPQVTWVKNVPLILNGWYTMTQLGAVGMKLFTNCSIKHGPTFSLPFGPLNVIATSDPVIIQKLLSSNTPTHLTKSGYIYKHLFVQELHDGLFVSKPETWVRHRKCLSRGFVYNRVVSCVGMINNHSEQLKNDILDEIEEHGSFSNGDKFARILGLNLLRFTGDLVTGPGTYTDHDVTQIHESIETHKECLLHVFKHPHLFLRPFWRLHPKKKVSDLATHTMLDAMRRMVGRYKEGAKGSDDDEDECTPLVKLMLDDKWSEKEILDNFATFIFAEHEATFAAIQFTLLHLSTNTHHQTSCRTEIDQIFTTPLTPSSLTHLKHLDRCIQESLRLTPPVPVFARRITSPLKTNNLTIPPGSTIMIMPWVLHRNPKYYPNPEIFDPDRFLPEHHKSAYTYLPFSAGRRNCLAWKLSLTHLKLTLAWILKHFHITSTDKLDNMTMYYAVRVVPEKNFDITFTKRNV